MKKRYILGVAIGLASTGVLASLAYRKFKAKDNCEEEFDNEIEKELSSDSEVLKDNIIEESVRKYYDEISDDNKISEQDLLAKIDSNEDCLIVDIRNEDYYQLNHIKNAVNVVWPYDIANKLYYLPQDKPIYIYCYTGQTSGQTVALLRILGFDAYSVNRGMAGLKRLSNIDDYLSDEDRYLTELPGTCLNITLLKVVTNYYDELIEVEGSKFTNNKIIEKDAKEMLDNDEDVCWLSIRSEQDYNDAHIKGAINIPFGKNMDSNFVLLPKDKKIIVYSYTGQTAGQTVATLRILGFDAVSINGGLGKEANYPSGWINKGFDLVS